MIVSAIDYRRGVVTYTLANGMELPVQEDWEVIPTLRIGQDLSCAPTPEEKWQLRADARDADAWEARNPSIYR